MRDASYSMLGRENSDLWNIAGQSRFTGESTQDRQCVVRSAIKGCHTEGLLRWSLACSVLGYFWETHYSDKVVGNVPEPQPSYLWTTLFQNILVCLFVYLFLTHITSERFQCRCCIFCFMNFPPDYLTWNVMSQGFLSLWFVWGLDVLFPIESQV